LIESIERLRGYALFASVPYSAMWANAFLVEDREPTAALIVAAHALGVLLVLLVSDRVDLDRGGSRGLALWKFPMGEADRGSEIALPVIALLALVTFAGLIAASVWLGLCATLLLLIGLWHATRARSRKYALVEVLGPVGVLIAPMALVGAFAHTPLGSADVGATALGAVLLGLVLLLCVTRDQPVDARRGWWTTATRLGRPGAGLLAWVWIIAAVLLSAMGAGWGWWAWPVSVVVALAAAVSGAAFVRGSYERLIAAWTIALWVAGVAFFVRAI
jgi:hypothetical protein